MANNVQAANNVAQQASLMSQTNARGETLVRVKGSRRRSICNFFASLCTCVCDSSSPPQIVLPAYNEEFLIPPQTSHKADMKTLVLDLDETLVHSSLARIPNPDLNFSVVVEEAEIPIYVLIRPGLQELLNFASSRFEVVVFTASVARYADPLLDILDPNGLIDARLFREHCELRSGSYIKDLSRLGRKMENVILVDVRIISEL